MSLAACCLFALSPIVHSIADVDCFAVFPLCCLPYSPFLPVRLREATTWFCVFSRRVQRRRGGVHDDSFPVNKTSATPYDFPRAADPTGAGLYAHCARQYTDTLTYFITNCTS